MVCRGVGCGDRDRGVSCPVVEKKALGHEACRSGRRGQSEEFLEGSCEGEWYLLNGVKDVTVDSEVTKASIPARRRTISEPPKVMRSVCQY